MDSTLTSAGPQEDVSSLHRARRAALGSFAGAVVDWYDFLLYGITAAPFTTNGESLNGAQRHQQHRGPPANSVKRRNNPYQCSGNPHHPDGEHQHAFTAKAIAKVAEDNPA